MSSTTTATTTILCFPYYLFLQPIDGNWSPKRGGLSASALVPPIDSRAKRNLHKLKIIHRDLNRVLELDVASLESCASLKVATAKAISRSRY